jgi:hypothetical protein
MSKDALRRAAAIGAVLALGAAPAALAAKPDDPGSQGQGHGKAGAHSKKGGKAVVTYVFKGVYAGAGSVDVASGNAHVKKADLVGTTVSFDLTDTKIVVSDSNADGTANADDVASGDRVVVKARLPRKEPGDQPYGAKQLVDQTHIPTS